MIKGQLKFSHEINHFLQPKQTLGSLIPNSRLVVLSIGQNGHMKYMLSVFSELVQKKSGPLREMEWLFGHFSGWTALIQLETTIYGNF